ncbi:MAG: bacterial transcriptional activator domain-containing protein [Acidimicrobiales bacterium]
MIGASKRAEAQGIDVEEIAFRSAAEEYYTGNFLEGSPHEEWTLLERDRLRMIYLDSANRLGDLLFARDDYQGALEVTRRALTRDPCDEPAHRRAMRCYAALGQRTSVVRQYQTCAEAMSRAFELDPDRETTAVYETLTDGDRGRLANRS